MAKKGDRLAPFVIQSVEGLKDQELESKEVGHGAYGAVYKVNINGLPYIAKRLHKALVEDVEDSDKIKKKFREECITLSKLKHPNIVHFVGVHYHGKTILDITLIMECLQSDLAEFLKKHSNIPLPVKLSILLDVTYGLLYLHTYDPPIVHRDLTARNVFVTAEGLAKIGDLGGAKQLTIQALGAKHTTAPGTPHYMPPEALIENPECTPKIDIFSFGHLALYTFNQAEPAVFELESFHEGENQKLKRKRAFADLGQRHFMCPLISRCLHDKPDNRPTAVELNKIVKEFSIKHSKSVKDTMALFNGSELSTEKYDLLMKQHMDFKASSLEYIEELSAEIKELKVQLHQQEIGHTNSDYVGSALTRQYKNLTPGLTNSSPSLWSKQSPSPEHDDGGKKLKGSPSSPVLSRRAYWSSHKSKTGNKQSDLFKKQDTM